MEVGVWLRWGWVEAGCVVEVGMGGGGCVLRWGWAEVGVCLRWNGWR